MPALVAGIHAFCRDGPQNKGMGGRDRPGHDEGNETNGAGTMTADTRATELTRREALSMLGAGAAAATLPGVASAEPTFPEGAVIRTVLKDYRPEELDGGASLFHEHMSLAPDFLQRFRQYAIEAQAVNRPPNAPPAPPPTTPPPDLSFMRDLD